MADTEYQCQVKGHEGSRTFIAASPEWFLKNGMPNTPKNCKPCKAWMDNQADESAMCGCGTKFTIFATQKAYHFKKIGPYEPITECKSCREGNPPVKGTKKRPDRKKTEKKEEEKSIDGFDSLSIGITPQPRPILKSGTFYDRRIPNRKVRAPHIEMWKEARWVHLMHHVPGSEFDWTNRTAADAMGLDHPSSPTSCVGHNASLDELLDSVGGLLQQTSAVNVREYNVSPDGKRIARVTFSGNHDNLELTILDYIQNGNYGVVSTYDNVDVAYVKGQDWHKP